MPFSCRVAILYICIAAPFFSLGAGTLSADSIHTTLSVLTADSLEGREAGKPGQKKAAAYLASLYDQWNIPAPVKTRFQSHPLNIRANPQYNLKASGANYIFYRDFFYFSGRADTSFIFNNIVFAGYGNSSASYDDFKNINATDQAVLIQLGELTHRKLAGFNNQTILQKLKAVSEEKPALVLLSVDSLDQRIAELKNDQELADGVNSLPFRVIFLSKKCAAEIMDTATFNLESRLEKINRRARSQSMVNPVQLLLATTSNTDALTAENVFGYIEGTDLKNELIVLSAHYDHLGMHKNELHPGADDDGSGTAAILEMARVFSEQVKNGHRPRRSILFMNTSGEEKGLLGSKWYTEHPLFPLEQTVVNLNVDMIGRIDSAHLTEGKNDYTYIISSFKESDDLIRYNEQVNDTSTKLLLDYKYSDPADPNAFYRRSDHYNFVKKHVPILFYFNGVHADYHRPTDTIDKINFRLLTRRAQLIFNTAKSISDSNVMFSRPTK